MSQDYWAHLGANGNQHLRDHLVGVSRRAAVYAMPLRLSRAGELIGLMHDLGKASHEFQAYLRSFAPGAEGSPRDDLRGKVDHSTAGAQSLLAHIPEADKERSLASVVAHVLALCIASHHSGMIDCLAPDGADGLTRRLLDNEPRVQRLNEAWSHVDSSIRSRAEELMRDAELTAECRRVFASMSVVHGDIDLQFGLLVRFLFSCLIDADRTDTADFENPVVAQLRPNRRYMSWDVLLDRLQRAIAKMDSRSEVNRIRSEISDQCFRAAARAPGVYTLTVPTGGGKTLAALRYALEHARTHGLERIIFVSPYISIVDQNASVAREILELKQDPYASIVLEHHSNLARESDFPSPAQWRRRVLAENWDAPVVFTTSAQVLEALFGQGTRPVRRLHAMAQSILIFDEVQTLPIQMVHLFNNAINFLVSHCKSSVLLCTATQPILSEVDKKKGAACLGSPPEIVPDVQALFKSLRRYEVFDHTGRPGSWTLSETAGLVQQEALTYGSCLAIVNTKTNAKELYQLLRLGSDARVAIEHLSTNMCPAHRLEVLDRLKQQLPQASPEHPLICVSTQLIEAGVDIDFATVVRDLAGLDSLAQSAGRCNRHGSRPQQGRVHIVELPEPPRQLEEIRKGRGVAREILGTWRRMFPKAPFPLDDPEQMRRYYEFAFYRRQDEMSFDIPARTAGRDTTLLDLLGSNRAAQEAAARTGQSPLRPVLLQSFQTAGAAFKLIAETQGIVVPFGPGGREIVSALSASFDLEVEWQLLRKAQTYTVSVYDHQFRKLRDAGAIYEAQQGAGVYCLHPQFYDKQFGLSMEPALMEDLNV
jgi:CRISPR-associated endonuclease/helicase Cas3